MLRSPNVSGPSSADLAAAVDAPPVASRYDETLHNGSARWDAPSANDSLLDSAPAEDAQELSGQLLIQSLVPFYTATMVVLAIIIVAALVFLPSPDKWARAGACLVALMLVGLFRWCARTQRVSAARNDLFQFALVVIGAAATTAVHFGNSYYKTEYGFITLALVMSILFHSIKTCILANVFVAAAWAYTWHASGSQFSDTILINHLAIVPLFSCAIFASRRHILGQLLALYQDQQQRHVETEKAVRVAREEAVRRADSEVELKRQKALLELILETVPDGIFLKDRQRGILIANQAFYDDWKLEREQVIGKTIESLLPPEVVELSRETDEYVLQHRESLRREFSVTDSDGREEFHECQKLPMLEDGEIIGILAVCRNLTERKQAEERFKRQEALLLHSSRLSSMGELVAGIAHEVNQPLFSILNYAKAIENTLSSRQPPDISATRKWVRQILREATRGGKITQRLKSFVKRADTHRETADMGEIVRESIDFIAAEARHKGVILEVDLADGLEPLSVDRVQIQQVLVNLIKNSIEAFAGQINAAPMSSSPPDATPLVLKSPLPITAREFMSTATRAS